jgi:hypothetical protein
MAEILGIASGIAGLLTLTVEVIKISSNYVSEVHGASHTVRRLVNELEDLKTVLLRIDQITTETDEQEIYGNDGACILSVKQNNECLDLLETVRRKLRERLGQNSVRQKMKALTWPFSDEKNKVLIESLHRHLNIYKTALAVDTFTVGKLTLTEARNSRAAYQQTQVEAVLDWLSPLNMSQRQQDALSRRHGTTGSWLLSTTAFQLWVKSEGSHRTLWCPGDPGTGKTVMTSIVVDHLTKTYSSDNVRIAYVYCDYKDQAMQTASNLIACLARQLIGRPQVVPHRLDRLYKELEPQRRRPNLEESIGLLVALCNERERTFVLVDALDECEAIHERRLFLPLLQSLPHGSTRLFVTSRPNNEDIYSIFSAAPRIVIAAPESDIRRFVTERMEERREFMERLTPRLKDQIITTISARASGM